jgi:hypothetical protein
MEVTRYKRRHWAVRDTDETLICVCVYRKGAREVVRRLCPGQSRISSAPLERSKRMGYYVAFPAHLLEELLALLPPDERPIYAERFEEIVGDLVWVRQDAENAVEAAIAEGEPIRGAPSPALLADLKAALLNFEDDTLVERVTECLKQTARTLVNARIGWDPETSKG